MGVYTIGGRRRGGSGHLVMSVTFCARAAMVGEGATQWRCSKADSDDGGGFSSLAAHPLRDRT